MKRNELNYSDHRKNAQIFFKLLPVVFLNFIFREEKYETMSKKSC